MYNVKYINKDKIKTKRDPKNLNNNNVEDVNEREIKTRQNMKRKNNAAGMI